MKTNCTITDKDGKVTDYVWDDQQKIMIEGKRERDIPWWRIHQIADELNGTVLFKTIIHSNGKHVKQITIEFEEEN